jgi:phosphoglycolate phosphatase/putative hydrolase of the HAD superfamily
MSTRQYDAWLVDLDGTLYDAKWVKLAMACELAIGGWSAVATLRRFRHAHEALRGQVAEDELGPFGMQLEVTARELGVDRAAVHAHVTTWMIRRPGKWIRMFRRRSLFGEIAAFRASGGRTALVSDYPATEKLVALGHSDLFDVVVASGEPGGPRRLKPAPDGLLAAAELLRVPAPRCLVLGDRDVDRAAADAASMAFRLVR